MVRKLVIALALGLVACGPRTAAGRVEAGPQYWMPPSSKEVWRIGGFLETRRVPSGLSTRPEHEVGVTVNGRQAMRGAMPRDRAVQLTGRMDGADLAAFCSPQMVARATLQVTCLVLISNERAATLTLVAGT